MGCHSSALAGNYCTFISGEGHLLQLVRDLVCITSGLHLFFFFSFFREMEEIGWFKFSVESQQPETCWVSLPFRVILN